MSFLGCENMAIPLSETSVLVLYITSGVLVLLTGGMCFLGGPDSKESTCIAVDPGSVPELGRYPGEGNGNPL